MEDGEGVTLHVVDLAFARFAALYVDYGGLAEGVSPGDLEPYACERDSNVVEVPLELAKLAFHLARRYQLDNRNSQDRRDMTCSYIRKDFMASGFPAPG